MSTHLDTLRRIRHAADNVDALFPKIDHDLDREAGMDGNYARLLQAARDLDAAAPTDTPARSLWIVKDGASHPWIIECPTDIPGVMGAVASVGYRPNAARIVQCVNDCAGISTPGVAIRTAREALGAALGAISHRDGYLGLTGRIRAALTLLGSGS